MHLPHDMKLMLKRCSDPRNDVASAQWVENKHLELSVIKFVTFLQHSHSETSSTDSLGTATLQINLDFEMASEKQPQIRRKLCLNRR
jgi:hypothetical protein